MKKGAIVLAILFTIVIFSSFLYLTNKTGNLTGFSVYTPDIPTDCSDLSIQDLWNSVFKESSTGITIHTNTTATDYICTLFFAYKIDGTEVYLLYGGSSFENTESYITAIHGEFIESCRDYLTASDNVYDIYSLIEELENYKNVSLRATSITTSTEANNTFSQFFEETPGNWNSGNVVYGFSKEFTNSSLDVGFYGIVNKNYSAETITIEEDYLTDCTPSWIAHSTPCNETTETNVTYYTDSNNCGTNTGKPANITLGCDYNNNGIIGTFSSFSESNTDLEIYLSGEEGNLSKTYNTSKTIEFREGNITRIKFNYAFDEPLNIQEISIKKQPASTPYGYLIVNGIDVSKTLTIDKKNSSSNKVCIRDREDATEISNITSDCSASSEYLVDCPGSEDRFTCNISGGRFVVSGLRNSGVREVTSDITPINCTPSWICTSWGTCTNNTQTRTCTDSNSCGVASGKPSEHQSCVSCVPNWNCTEWTPERCPKEEKRTRTCTDTNSCGTTSGKPSESKFCEYESRAWIFILIIGLIGLVIIIIVILILMNVLKKREFGNREAPIVQQPKYRPPPSPPPYQGYIPQTLPATPPELSQQQGFYQQY